MVKRRRAKASGDSSSRYPGLADNLVKVVTRNGSATIADFSEALPEVSLTAIRWNLTSLRRKRILNSSNANGNSRMLVFTLASENERNLITEDTVKVPAVQQLNGRTAKFNQRQIESIILRMENVNEAVPTFTETDFYVLRSVLKVQ